MADVFCKFHERNDAVLGPDFEYTIDGNDIRVNRFFPFSLDDELQISNPSQEALLSIERPGQLESLHWNAKPATDPAGDHVGIEVYAAGLNFRVCSPSFHKTSRALVLIY